MTNHPTIKFHKKSDAFGLVWIGDGSITEQQALDFAATAAPTNWTVQDTDHFPNAWVVLVTNY